MSYKFDRGRVPPREVKRFRAVPRVVSSSLQVAYFCRIQCPVVGVGLVCGFICVRYRYFDGFPVLSADRVE